MVAFGDLKSDSGLKKLDEFLLTRSYISGFQPSQADVTTYTAVGKLPSANYINVLRWYKHIDSFGAERKQFPAASESGDVEPQAKPAAAAAAAAPAKAAADEDDDDDLFGSDEDEEYEKLRQERQAAYEAKKANKPAVIAKSNIILDVKPWDDETDMGEVEKAVRSIEHDGLVWGASKLVPLAYGIKKLQIGCVVEDDKVGTDFLEEEITKFDELVQSVDIAAFNKV